MKLYTERKKVNNNDNASCSGSGWDAFFHPAEDSVLDFRIGGRKLLSLSGVTGNGIDEPAGAYPRFRHHHFNSIRGGQVEMDSAVSSAIPGCGIKRAIEYAGNRFRFISDISFSRAAKTQEVCIDNVKIFLKCSEIGTISADDTDKTRMRIEWRCTEDEINFSKSSTAPIAWLFKMDDGILLEIGTGDDLWRWNVGSAMNLSPEFSIIAGRDSIVLSRKVINRVQEETSIARKFRFTWYFAWHLPGETTTYEIPDDCISLDLCTDFEWPGSAKVEIKDGTFFDYPCFHSDFVWNALRKAVRKNIENGGKSIAFRNVRPMICTAGRHLGRAPQRHLEHWNMVSLMNFSLWATKQMSGKPGRLFFLPQEGDLVFASLPSFRGLSDEVYI